LVEEVESIATASPVLSIYLDILDAMLQHQENMLYIGPILDRLPAATVSRVQPVSVPAHIAARMFYMNLLTWRSNKFIRDNYPSSAIDRLEHDLEALSGDPDALDEIEWGMRQIVYFTGVFRRPPHQRVHALHPSAYPAPPNLACAVPRLGAHGM
jgi:hypothetical protein